MPLFVRNLNPKKITPNSKKGISIRNSLTEKNFDDK